MNNAKELKQWLDKEQNKLQKCCVIHKAISEYAKHSMQISNHTLQNTVTEPNFHYLSI